MYSIIMDQVLETSLSACDTQAGTKAGTGPMYIRTVRIYLLFGSISEQFGYERVIGNGVKRR